MTQIIDGAWVPDLLNLEPGTTLGDAIYVGNLEDGSEAWHAQRGKVIGGSDVASICDIPGRFQSPYILWLEKAGYKERDEVSPEMEELFEWGHLLEEPIIKRFTDMTGLAVARTGTWVNKDRSWHGINPDGLVIDHDGQPVGIMECKYSMMGFGYENEMLPAKYVAQVRYYAAGFGFQFGYLGAFFNGKLHLFMIPADMNQPVKNLRTGAEEYYYDDASTILPKVQEFVNMLATNTPPPLTGSGDELDWKLKRHPEIDGKDIVIPYDLAIRWADAREGLDAAEAQHRLVKAELLEAMGTAKNAKAGYDISKSKKAKTVASRRPIKGGAISIVAVGKAHRPEPYELKLEEEAAPAAA